MAVLLARNPTFLRLWAGQLVSVIGDGAQRLALLLWANEVGGNTLLLVMAWATTLPFVLYSPLGGSWADRGNRRRLLIGADVVRAASCVVVGAGLTWFDRSPGWLSIAVVASVFIAFSATAIFDPTYGAVVPTVVDDDDLPEANGLNLSYTAGGALIGPVVGGLLLTVVSRSTLVYINGATFVLSAVLISTCLIPPASPSAANHVGFLDALRGWPPTVMRIGTLALVANMALAPLTVMVVALGANKLKLPDERIGLLEGAVGLGLLVGALCSRALQRTPVLVPLLIIGGCVAALGNIGFVPALVLLTLVGAAAALTSTILLTMLQREVPSEQHGRTFAAVGALSESMRPVGMALGVKLLAAVGFGTGFAAVGGGLAAFAVLLARGLRLPSRVSSSPTVTVDRQPNQLVDQT